MLLAGGVWDRFYRKRRALRVSTTSGGVMSRISPLHYHFPHLGQHSEIRVRNCDLGVNCDLTFCFWWPKGGRRGGREWGGMREFGGGGGGGSLEEEGEGKITGHGSKVMCPSPLTVQTPLPLQAPSPSKLPMPNMCPFHTHFLQQWKTQWRSCPSVTLEKSWLKGWEKEGRCCRKWESTLRGWNNKCTSCFADQHWITELRTGLCLSPSYAVTQHISITKTFYWNMSTTTFIYVTQNVWLDPRHESWT